MSRKTACSTVFMALIIWSCGASLVVPASAQHFVQVKGSLDSVSAGRNEVFGVDTSQHVWRYHATTKSFAKIAKPLLSQVAVGGGETSFISVPIESMTLLDISADHSQLLAGKFVVTTGTHLCGRCRCLRVRRGGWETFWQAEVPGPQMDKA